MASDRQYLRVSWLFSISGTEEIANTSLNYSLQTGTSFDALTAFGEVNWPVIGENMGQLMGTFLSTSAVKWADYAELNAIRLAPVGVDGLELAAPKIHDITGGLQGLDGDVNAQSTIVLSLRSMQVSPGANYGRMFLPYTAFTLTANSPMAVAADVSTFANDAETFIEGCEGFMNAQVTQVLNTMIISHISTPTQRESRGVASIAVGNVVDTQRRRRNKLPETYEFRSIT